MRKAIILLALIFVGCNNNEKFDSIKWKSDYNGRFLKRTKMVKSLINSDLIKNKKIDEVELLLGKPSYVDTLENNNLILIYNVQESYGWDIDPQFTADLNIIIDIEDNTVENFRLKESIDRRSWIEKMTTE